MMLRMEEELDRLKKRISEWAEEGQSSFGPVRAAYVSDVKQLKRLHSLIKSERYSEAARYYSGLDTIVRELVPQALYEFLRDYRARKP